MAKKTTFNMRMDRDLKSWIDRICSDNEVPVSGLVHGLLEAMREDRILVFPRHAPGVARAFPGSCPVPGSSPDNPALIAWSGKE
jgi:hypothetical protein